MTRKEFIGAAFAATAVGAFAPAAFAAKPEDIRAVLLHLGMNMWGDWRAPDEPKVAGKRYANEEISFSEPIWKRTVEHAAKRGYNMVVMDLGEFMEFPSHPELAVKGSWPAAKMAAEVKRLKAMGLEPVPKLNFSTSHDSWLKVYHRMVSSNAYYKVCADLIKDTCDVFGHPRYFHIGFDEERYENQRKDAFAVIRQGELWWHDLKWFCRGVEKLGARPWMFSDYGWRHPEFVEKCPKSVLQSNWYYNEDVQGYDVAQMSDWFKPKLRLFDDLDKAGFDQVPCPSNWVSPKQKDAGKTDNSDCAAEVVKYCRAHVASERLKGFLMASWTDCAGEGTYKFNCAGMDQLADAMGSPAV